MSRIKTAYSPKHRYPHDNGPDPSRTKQSMRDDTNINNIMAKYVKTGLVTHANANAGRYEFTTGDDFQSSVQLIQQAQELFDGLPSSTRRKFDNDPAAFLTFVADPENEAEMREMGLMNLPEGTTYPPTPPAEPEPTPATPPT